MKFENKGIWLQEAEDKLAAYDTQEHPDFLNGDDKVLTMEDGDDEELMNFEEDELDVVEEDDTLDSPEDEEMDLAMESSQKNEASMSDIKAKLKGAKEVPVGHYKRGNEQTIVANDSKGEHRLIISDTGYARLIERLNAYGRGEKVIEKVYKLNESSRKSEATETTPDINLAKQLIASIDKGAKNNEIEDFTDFVDTFSIMYYNRKHKFLSNDDAEKLCKQFKTVKFADESSQKNEGSNWEYSVSVLDNHGDIQYSTDCKSQSDIDNAIKKYKARAVELRNADNCTTIEVTKDLVDDDGNILKTQSIKKMSLESFQKNEAVNENLLKDMKDFKKYMDYMHKNLPDYTKERKNAIITVIKLLEELNLQKVII